MKKYDILRSVYHQGSAEEKLAALRNEMIMPISTIRGYTTIIRNKIDPNLIQGLPEDFHKWIEHMARASDDLHEILEALTGFEDRLVDE